MVSSVWFNPVLIYALDYKRGKLIIHYLIERYPSSLFLQGEKYPLEVLINVKHQSLKLFVELIYQGLLFGYNWL